MSADERPSNGELDRARTEFLDGLRHDLRSPLNAILGFAQLLELDDLSIEQREYVAEIIKGGQVLLELISTAP